MNRPPLSNVTMDAVLKHWEVGRAKDLSAPPRTKDLFCVRLTKSGMFNKPSEFKLSMTS